MKVLQVLCGGAWGGGSFVVLAITKSLIARGDEVWVVSLDEETDRRFRAAGARIWRAPLWLRPINPLDAVPLAALAWFCWRQRFDLVATHTSKGGFLGRLAARIAGVPAIVHHAHGFAFHKVLSAPVHRAFVVLEKVAAHCGDLIISVNKQHRDDAIRLQVAPPEQIVAIHNGVDVHAAAEGKRERGRKALGIPEESLVVGSVGRLAEQKGFIYLIRAMKQVLETVPDAVLVLCGDGPLREELEREATSLGIAGNVRFTGFRRDIPDILAAMDVFALPSLWEGLSISLLEAIAAGKAIVATDIDANREALRDGIDSLLVPAGRSDALADAVCRLAGNERLRTALALAARSNAVTRFSHERMVEQNIAAYDSVRLRKHRKPNLSRAAAGSSSK
jgi:glycosyltransferase involved in cell wall biosynthesis